MVFEESFCGDSGENSEDDSEQKKFFGLQILPNKLKKSNPSRWILLIDILKKSRCWAKKC
jgi:hypothetical protein